MKNNIVIVSGLPRSGTSMMMRMLEAGGIPPFTDTLRQADPDNPRGYYEYEPVKRLDQDASWMGSAAGHALKVISSLLKYLPPHHNYSVIFVNRAVEEILASQQAMLHRRVKQGEIDPTTITPQRLDQENEVLFQTYTRHVQQTHHWLMAQKNINTLIVEHRGTLENPITTAQQINSFLVEELDTTAMANAVEKQLYRQRI
ncbi:MAG: sulfotransferase family protein [Candidatus Hydrogenedentes bacterium]|nr:sulfotransferase family protein [Candidatus Hydrogenedentota bacterium]